MPKSERWVAIIVWNRTFEIRTMYIVRISDIVPNPNDLTTQLPTFKNAEIRTFGFRTFTAQWMSEIWTSPDFRQLLSEAYADGLG